MSAVEMVGAMVAKKVATWVSHLVEWKVPQRAAPTAG